MSRKEIGAMSVGNDIAPRGTFGVEGENIMPSDPPGRSDGCHTPMNSMNIAVNTLNSREKKIHLFDLKGGARP